MRDYTGEAATLRGKDFDLLDADRGKSYYGTCQACFGTFVVQFRQSTWTIVLHGYRRPGDGQTHGRCWGYNELPYELSCELTKAWLARTRAALPFQVERLSNLLAGDVTHLYVTMSVPYSNKLKTVEIGKSYRGDFGQTFEFYLRDAIYRQDRLVCDTRALISTLIDRVDTWTFNPRALLDAETETLDAKEREAFELRRERQRFARRWKDTWKYISEAVSIHRDLTSRDYFHGPKALEVDARQLPAFVRIKATRRKRA